MNKTALTNKLHSVGADFFLSSSKFVHSNDPVDAWPSYHIYPNKDHRTDDSIVRLFSEKSLLAWIEFRARANATSSQEEAERIMEQERNARVALEYSL